MLYMEEAEIVKRYREAKYPKEMIRILSEINLCTEKRIERILIDHGCKLGGEKKYNVSIGMNFGRNKSELWKSRMPQITEAIANGTPMKEIAGWYQVTVQTVYAWTRKFGGL